MVNAFLLLAYAVTAGTFGAAWLRDARWPGIAPRLAVAAWQALAASVLLALSATGLALAVTFPHVNSDLARLFDLCAASLRHAYAMPGGALTAGLGVALFLALVARTAWCMLRVAVSDRRERSSRVGLLDLLGRTDVLPGTLVIEHAAPYAFCVGGRRHRIVVTSGLLETLDPRELEAVLAHEDAHLRQRHHLAILVCRALFGTLGPLFPPFRTAMRHIRLYAELCADDSARKRVGATSLRTALATLACAPAPAGALAATAHDVETRLLRLSGRQRRLAPVGAAGVALGIGVAIVIPLALAAAPALAMAWEWICRLG